MEIIGTWQGKSSEVETSRIILKINKNQTFKMNGYLNVCKKEVFCFNTGEHLVADIYIIFSAKGKYCLSGEDSIKFTGIFYITQESLSNNEMIKKDYKQKINHTNYFSREILEKDNKLHFKSPSGIMGFNVGISQFTFNLKGFNDFIRI
jgi:hypothetical protein